MNAALPHDDGEPGAGGQTTDDRRPPALRSPKGEGGRAEEDGRRQMNCARGHKRPSEPIITRQGPCPADVQPVPQHLPAPAVPDADRHGKSPWRNGAEPTGRTRRWRWRPACVLWTKWSPRSRRNSDWVVSRRISRFSKVWNGVLDPNVVAHARPTGLRHGTLFVSVDNHVWLAEIVRYRRREILERLQYSFGPDLIRRVSFRAG